MLFIPSQPALSYLLHRAPPPACVAYLPPAAADFRQVEFRLMAHFSADPGLLHIFADSDADAAADPFRRLAAQWLDAPAEQVGPAFGGGGCPYAAPHHPAAPLRMLLVACLPSLPCPLRPRPQITQRQRDHAKQLAYALLYGMGHARLADELGCGLAEARGLQDAFRRSLPGLEAWKGRLLAECRRRGFVEVRCALLWRAVLCCGQAPRCAVGLVPVLGRGVCQPLCAVLPKLHGACRPPQHAPPAASRSQTLAGRRRYLPQINSANSHVSSAAERQALNTVCQVRGAEAEGGGFAVAADRECHGGGRACSDGPPACRRGQWTTRCIRLRPRRAAVCCLLFAGAACRAPPPTWPRPR